MARRKVRKQDGLLERILDVEPGIKASLASEGLGEASVMGLQRTPLDALMAQYSSLHVSEAQRLKDRLDVASAALMRAFRERRLSAQGARAGDEIKGPLAQSTGPTFENQFSPSWANNAHPQAVDATVSPAAYLIDMLMFARDHVEAQGDAAKILSLQTRRPDLFELVLDEQNLRQEVPQVEVINHVLQRAIEDSPVSEDLAVIEDKLLQVRTPLKRFPYETYWEQIRTVLAHNQLALSDVSRLTDIEAPYFTQPGAHSQWSNTALQQDSSLGPALRAILIEPAYFEQSSDVRYNPQTRRLLRLQSGEEPLGEARLLDNAAFFTENFGVLYPTLLNVVNFCQALQMTQVEMESLFGLAAFAPVRSDNLSGDLASVPATPARFGARFINSGGAEPVSVASDDQDLARHHFLHLTQDRCDRVQRLLRLAQALKLPYAQVDQVVCAAIDAERRASPVMQDDGSAMWMTVNTLRALGMFQFLRERFSCSSEDFATLLSHMAIHGVGDAQSHFDRVFNSDTTTPLVLDGGVFSIGGEDAASKRTIDQLCRGLAINMETFRYLSRMILQSQGQLTRSLATISAFYRVTVLARLLSVTVIELLSLLEVMSPEGLYALQLGGEPRNAMHNSLEHTDSLSVIYGVCACVLWCQERQLPISWLVQQLMPIVPTQVVAQDIVTFLDGLKNNIVPFLDLDRDLQQAGVPPLRTQTWSENLLQIVDAQGLAVYTGNIESALDPAQYEHFVSREVREVIVGVLNDGIPNDPELPSMGLPEQERLKLLIVSVVLRIRRQQWDVVQEQLSTLLSLTADLVIPVLYWAGGTVHTLLRYAQSYDSGLRQANSEELAFLPLIERLRRCAQVISRFNLSPMLITSLQVRSEQPRYSIISTDLTLHTLYALERYTHCVRLARQSEEALLGYFSLVEALGELSANERRLIRDQSGQKVADWLGWGIREVLDVAAHITDDGIIRNLAQLNVVVNIRQLCEQTRLSAVSLLKLSRLSSHADTHSFRDAAQEMLGSLRSETHSRRDEAELRQSLTAHCLVSDARLVAIPNGPSQETTITLKLLDLNSLPVADIRVRWSTTLGTLLADFSYTDQQGVASVTLQGGPRVGVAHVTATYLLETEVVAPPIIVDCDEDSLSLSEIRPKPHDPWQPAGNKGEYAFSVQLVDRYDNPGVDRLITWYSEIGTFSSTQLDVLGETLTDSEGYSRVILRSQQPGVGRLEVWQPGKSLPVESLTVGFSDQPSISALVLTSWAVLKDPIEVKAIVRGLNGEPVAGCQLKWESSGASFDDTDDVSNPEGEAKATLHALQAGPLEVTVALLSADASAQVYVSETLVFEVLADAQLRDAIGDTRYPPADGISASEYQVSIFSSDGKPVANYPVEWLDTDQATCLEKTFTGQDGIARFALRSANPRAYQVTANAAAAGTHIFDEVKFTSPLVLQVLFQGQPLNSPIIIQEPEMGSDPFELIYHLQVEDDFWKQQPMRLLYSGVASEQSLGLSFMPRLGESQEFADLSQMKWTITCTQYELLHEGTFRLGLTHEHAWATIWIDAVVKPSSAAR
ncbi:Ig-like domain-containing protein [Pseudomonas sp. UFMG81]|uniref:Ig-like domain-containing protein n=1 Tax=Pseudomonas sp. UFMG81 TaxID=2745936 RepID=UPI00188E7E8E|nr:Tc toxin subunit A [Pseudomonas sp. UFMG81]